MHESINRIWQSSPVENKEVNKFNRSVPWMFLKAQFLTVLVGEAVRCLLLLLRLMISKGKI